MRGEKLIRSERRKRHDQIANKEDQMTNIQASQSRKRKEVSHTKIEKHPQKTGTGDKPSERKAERRRRAKSGELNLKFYIFHNYNRSKTFTFFS